MRHSENINMDKITGVPKWKPKNCCPQKDHFIKLIKVFITFSQFKTYLYFCLHCKIEKKEIIF